MNFLIRKKSRVNRLACIAWKKRLFLFFKIKMLI